jgi:SAM-dependent methyltransferase
MKRIQSSLIPAPYRARAKRVLQRFQPARFREPYLWETLANPSVAGAAGQYPEARPALVDLVRGEPRRLIDLGCGNGATASVAKDRFPDAEVIGVERNPAAAKLAAVRLDRVLMASIENMDYDGYGIREGSVDVAFLLDVLEHLYDPWDALLRLRPRLAPEGQVIASIPNVRNYWLLSHLLNEGQFSYDKNGLLDITHIRFFTRREIERLFAETGYCVKSLTSVIDDRAPEVLPVRHTTKESAKFVLQNLTAEDVAELRTIQYYVVATPA